MNVSAIIVTRGDRKMAERFVAKVIALPHPEGCWLWTGATSRGGYGAFWTGKRTESGHPRAEGAHRVAYELFVGPIPEGLEIDHLCRNPGCVNPEHLEPVTRLENQRRGFSPMQAQRKQTHCKRGHPLNAENTYVWKNMRRCRRCNAEQQAEIRRRRRSASQS